MENRRRHYRHVFSPHHRLKVSLGVAGKNAEVVGEIADLSVAGMRVESAQLGALTGDQWIASFSLEPEAKPLRIAVERVYVDDVGLPRCGFRFLPPANLLVRDEQEKAIWKFLLDAQRSDRRRIQEANAADQVMG